MILDFVAAEDAGEGVGDDPGQTPAEVDEFVGDESDDTWNDWLEEAS